MASRLKKPELVTVGATGWKSLVPEKINKEVIVARAGTEVVCPKCGVRIGRLYSDLYSGVSCRADQIEFDQGQKRHPNEKAECRQCGTGYMRMSMSHRNGTTVLLSVVIGGQQIWI